MLKQIILTIYRPIYLLRVFMKKTVLKVTWSRYGKRLRYPLAKNGLIELDPTKVYLVLAPHSDDEWIGCSQILRTMPKSYVCYMDMPGGDNDEVHQKRYEEIKKGVESNGRQLYKVSEDKLSSLNDIITSIHPDYILVPYYFDWHEEHIAIMQLLKQVLAASEYQCNILMYQVSVPMPKEACNVCIPMTKKEENEKWHFFHEVYKTQSFMPVKRFMAYERIEGGLAGSHSAEVYAMTNSKEWIKKLDSYILGEDVRKEIKTQLNNIPYVLDRVCSLYNQTL